MAERKGFEPLIPFGIRAFQARALGQTTLPLQSILQDATAILPLTSLIGKANFQSPFSSKIKPEETFISIKFLDFYIQTIVKIDVFL